MPVPDQLRLALTSTQEVALGLKPILSAGDIPMAVHGTNRAAWASICSPYLRRRETSLIVVM